MNSSETAFADAVVNHIETALPEVKTVRWIHSLDDMPAVLQQSEIFAWIVAEQAEPPRLINSDKQTIRIELAVAIVLAKNPRANKDSKTATLKQKLRSALEGWVAPRKTNARFLPMRLNGGAPLTSRSAGGVKLWIERTACRLVPIR